ncbi:MULTISPECIES: hypothetical protein [Actinomadura]|uniref:Uncharacterized protein n=1 Tax=Actinomadura madurae TaxID=1993 RepID=A0A1I4Z7D3_9ACTN|nr:hypothetical protein [Actinomadura madurae]SFN45889.1 hypothetical protein SAMN04489713_10273 [Actinomadura madurae]SPT49703.1 Uncharacterised protein [Actinomadura madurae]
MPYHHQNIIQKFGSDGNLERTWVLPRAVDEPLRPHVMMSDDGNIMMGWVVTEEIAPILQPWVDEPIDLASGEWHISCDGYWD